MEIVLPQFRHIGPGRATKHRAQIIGIPVRRSVTPDEIIVIGVILSLSRLYKPGMLIGAVIEHQVQNNGNVPFLRLIDQLLHILHGAKHRVHGAIIGNIISVIHLRRQTDRRQPDTVDAQLLQIVQPGNDTLQISHTVSGGILKTLRVDLVEYRVFPPAFFPFV